MMLSYLDKLIQWIFMKLNLTEIGPTVSEKICMDEYIEASPIPR